MTGKREKERLQAQKDGEEAQALRKKEEAQWEAQRQAELDKVLQALKIEKEWASIAPA